MADQAVVLIKDANGTTQPIGCIPYPNWGGYSGTVYLQATSPTPWQYTIITASGNTTVKASPGILGGLWNLYDQGSQNGNSSVYDNATTNSGVRLINVDNLAQSVDFLSNGVQMQNGITVNLAQNAQGDGYLVLWQ